MSEFKYAPPSYEMADSLLMMAQHIEIGKQKFTAPAASFLREAADRVQRQHDEIERLRVALREMADIEKHDGDPALTVVCEMAREALDETSLRHRD